MGIQQVCVVGISGATALITALRAHVGGGGVSWDRRVCG